MRIVTIAYSTRIYKLISSYDRKYKLEIKKWY